MRRCAGVHSNGSMSGLAATLPFFKRRTFFKRRGWGVCLVAVALAACSSVDQGLLGDSGGDAGPDAATGDGDGDASPGDGDGPMDGPCVTDADCALPHTMAACEAGVCVVDGCATGYRDCDLLDDTGCESPPVDPDNCGGCGIACEIEHGSPTCISNTCLLDVCDDDWGDCDDVPLDCETPLNTLADCGGCGVACSDDDIIHGTASCATGVCGPDVCDDGYADCNGVPVDGCEQNLLGMTGCGQCADGHGQCDGIARNGCEALDTVVDCGGCGQACNVANGSGDCSTGSCQVASCNADWADCDGNPGNGCEQQVSVVGPCLPDDTCERRLFGQRGYFVCQDARSWDEAQARCRGQLYGDLVRIDDAAEQAFVQGEIAGPIWIGGSDAGSEGQWRWSDNGMRFWQGDAGGMATGGAYAKWDAGEPNGSGNCQQMYADGTWDDTVCAGMLGYVCELQGDP